MNERSGEAGLSTLMRQLTESAIAADSRIGFSTYRTVSLGLMMADSIFEAVVFVKDSIARRLVGSLEHARVRALRSKLV